MGNSLAIGYIKSSLKALKIVVLSLTIWYKVHACLFLVGFPLCWVGSMTALTNRL